MAIDDSDVADVSTWVSGVKQINLTLLLWLCVSNHALADWQDWWRTPEQQARAAYDKGDNDELMRLAPDATWQGVAEHEDANYESAAKTFDEVVTRQDLAGNTGEATRALYNRAVSEVRLGEYEKAVESFDQVLERNPEFADAQYNREIASQLAQQQEQQQQQSSSQPQAGDESDDDNDSESQDPSEQQDSSSDEEQSQSGEQQPGDSQASERSEQAESGAEQGDSDASDTESEAEQLRDQQAAQEALDAEAQQSRDDDGQSDQDDSLSAAQREEPLSESEQATEQWLRRIPDDPAGLLRRKLEQSHRIEYPEVRNAQEPW